MDTVKIHGAFRSGTNYVKALLELNYDVEVDANSRGWKHAPVNRDPGWPIVGVVKDPYAWLVSMWTFVHDGPGAAHVTATNTWGRFLADPITITHGQDDRVPVYRWASPVHYWNAMATNLLSVGRVVRYEDVLADPERIRAVAEALGLTPTTETIQGLEQRVRNIGPRRQERVAESYTTDDQFDPNPYLDRSYFGNFSRWQRRRVDRQLDPAATRALSYPA